MNRTRVFLAILLTGCLQPAVILAQGSGPYSTPPKQNDIEQTNAVVTYPLRPEGDQDRFSNWTMHPRPFCSGCGFGPPPIQTELYLRSGPAFVVGGGTYGHALGTGWDIQVGAKALFFNHPLDAAWVVDFSISNHNNSAEDDPVRVPLVVEVPNIFGDLESKTANVTIRRLNRTFVNVGLGRDWYLWAPADFQVSNLRVGIDGGGRYGSARADFFEITHLTDVIGGVYMGAHADLDIPCGARCIFHAGIRLEYGYNWTDILQKQSDFQDINVLFEIGWRF